jgi:hypothetical protein
MSQDKQGQEYKEENPVADSVENDYPRDVIGQKNDTNAGNSLMSSQQVPPGNSAINGLMRDVVGSKSDSYQTGWGTGYSAISYLKGILVSIKKATTDAFNNVYMADVIGSKDDTARTTSSNGYSIIAYLKGLINQYMTYITDAVLAQATPVQNTWYTVLNTTTGKVRLYGIGVRVNTTGETLEVCVTIDGVMLFLTAGVACGAGTEYYCSKNFATGGTTGGPYLSLGTTAVSFMLNGFVDCKSLKVQIRKTTASGTGTLYGRVTYGYYV